MSASLIATSYTIEWCRNWLLVSKIVKLTGGNCETVSYSDWGTDTTPSQWTEGQCSWPVAIGWTDITIDLIGTGTLLPDYIWVRYVHSVTIVPYANKMIQISWLPKLLKAGQAYTWSQWDENYIDLNSFVFTVDWGQLEIIWEAI